MPSSESEVILEHALRNEENLRVAALVGASYGVLCGRLIAEVLEPVAKELASRLGPNWQVDTQLSSDQLQRKDNVCITARLKNHHAGLSVVLATDASAYPKEPYFGIRVEDKAKAGDALLNQIKVVANQNCGTGRTGYSTWYRYADKPHGVWGTPDSLVGLYRKTEAVTYFLDRLEVLCKAIATTLSVAIE